MQRIWWPREGSIAYALASVPAGYGVVRALSHSFIPRRRGEGSFAELMTVRLASTAPINDAATPFRPVAKALIAPSPCRGRPWEPQRLRRSMAGAPWMVPLEVLELPLRSPEQVARKHRNTLESWQRNLRGDLARARSIEERVSPRPSSTVSLRARASSRRAWLREYFEDTRLRDTLRTFRADKGSIEFQRIDHPAVRADRPSTADTVRHATELQSLADAELVRLARRIDELGARVVRKESAQRRRNSFRP